MVENVCADGFSAQVLLSGLCERVICSPDWSDTAKATIAIKIAQAEKMMIDGGDEYLQLMTVCSHAAMAVTIARAENRMYQ